MLSTLPESAGGSRRSPGGVAWSILLHVTVIALVTAVTARRVTPAPPPPIDADSVTWVDMMPTRQSGGGGGTSSSPSPPSPAVPVPVEVPIGLPPIDPVAPPIQWAIGDAVVDPSELVRGHTGRANAAGGGDGPGAPYASRPERLAAALLGNPRPRYPGMLRTAAIEGEVLIDCVVDTTGAIDPTSVRIIDSDHDAFTAAVREVLPRLRFTPAETGGHKVRQWVRIPFEFRLSPRAP